jgi:hypothetical protein
MLKEHSHEIEESCWLFYSIDPKCFSGKELLVGQKNVNDLGFILIAIFEVCKNWLIIGVKYFLQNLVISSYMYLDFMEERPADCRLLREIFIFQREIHVPIDQPHFVSLSARPLSTGSASEIASFGILPPRRSKIRLLR